MDLEVLENKRRNWLNMTCPICGIRFHLKQSAIPKSKNHYCSKLCHNIAKVTYCSGDNNHQYGLRGSKNPTWKGGRKQNGYGYWMVQRLEHPFAIGRCKYVLEHRLVAEQYLLDETNSVIIEGRRYLSPEYVVHHKNGIRTDNRPENLQVMKKGTHVRLHNAEVEKTRMRDNKGRYLPRQVNK